MWMVSGRYFCPFWLSMRGWGQCLTMVRVAAIPRFFGRLYTFSYTRRSSSWKLPKAEAEEFSRPPNAEHFSNLD
jgi:hypothetical protein